ncbi:MAG: aldose sugar dehydrogenase [Thermoproteota archaeon]|nr:aldose sugar dehydrogenase [Thermoproteota archaeon]
MRRKLAPGNFEVIASRLEIPWSLDFAPDGRLFFTERVGRLSTIFNGKIKPLLQLDVEAQPGDEGGLLGLAVDPDFVHTHLIYVYYTYRDEEEDKIWNRISCFVEAAGKLAAEKVIFDKIPAGRVHNGGRIKFGPDGKLYVTAGENWKRELAQRLDFLGGKILRMNRDGSIPSDNPFSGSPVYCYGNRNAQGLTWHPVTGKLFATEHGPSGENGWYAHDKINIIESGKNYGWPYVIGYGKNPQYTDPIFSTEEITWAPSGATFYNGTRYPGWDKALFIACLRGVQLRAITLNPPSYVDIESNVALFEGELGRLRDVVQGPDDYLYLCTSNRDGRGEPDKDDDLIIRIKSIP